LRLDGRPVAFEFHLRGSDKQHAMRASFDQEFAALSPGAYLEMQILKNIFEQPEQVSRFDFGGSSDPYKKRWSDHARPLVSLQVFNDCFYSRLCALHETGLVQLARGVRDCLRSSR
jgi:CelD/BcsL family acetyltransferase involved in cellulose biosynthesis